jgi:predicted AAA+ superfamily ATPase
MLDFSWKDTLAAIWRPKQNRLRPIYEMDILGLDDLLGIENQKLQMVQNTKQFINNKPFNHVLLWGARGTGKSSLIKAMLPCFQDKNLRIVEFFKEDLQDLPDVVDDLRTSSYKFIIFCDDLSFEVGDYSYKGLKPVLEGSIESPPCNIMICATSNRRHLVSENISDNAQTKVAHGELHYGDMIEEKISLSDRFGLWLSFYHGSQNDYLELVEHYFKDYKGDKEALYRDAKVFATMRASRSGRTAKQFYNAYCEQFLKGSD